jgi:hypothetical protein
MQRNIINFLLIVIFNFGFSQSPDSIQFVDTTRVEFQDTLRANDSLQVQPSDSLQSTDIQDSLVVDSVQTTDSLEVSEPTRIVNVDSLQRAEMRKLHFLRGEWRGVAWTIGPNREKHYIIQTEKVEVKQSGLVLTIQGSGVDQKSLQTKPKMVHDAFAVLYFDKQRQKVQIMAFTKGYRILTEPIVRDDQTLIWGFSIAGTGEVRYTTRLNERGQWFEIGEFSRDGVNWVQNFEMTLDRVD